MQKIKFRIFHMTENKSFIAAAVFVTLLFFIFLFTAIGDEILCWINNNDGLASWVQAIGAISAIVFAGYQVSWQIENAKEMQRRNEFREELLILDAYINVADQAALLIESVHFEFKNGIVSNLNDYMEKIELRIEMLKSVFSSKTPSYSIDSIIQVVDELINTKKSIQRYLDVSGVKDNVQGIMRVIGDEEEKIKGCVERAYKAKFRLSDIKRMHSY